MNPTLSPDAQARAAEERHFWVELSQMPGAEGIAGRILLAAGDPLRNAILQELKEDVKQYTVIRGVGDALGNILVTLAGNLSDPNTGLPKGVVLGMVLGKIIGARIQDALEATRGADVTVLYEIDGQLTDLPAGRAS
ncbi:hypothetical protein V5F49_11115 [Xanthobacter sp. V3C-3]|uniref:hypothetical protein n=1 Tax=Xanthobacter lutulentifluminis TaxID=3119935 RepID=UPI0037267BDF